MKWLQRIFFFTIAAGVLMAPQTAQVNTYVDGNVLTAAQLNAEFGNLYSTVNSLDEDNLLDTTSIPANYVNAAIAGDGVGRDAGTGVLEVNVDDSTIEINADTLRVKDSGITSAKILNDTIVAGDIATGGVATAEILDGTIITDDIATGGVATADILDGTVATADLATDLTVTHAVGSAGNPTITFVGDTNTGLYRSSADNVTVTAGGSAVATFDSNGIEVAAGVSTGNNGAGHYLNWKVFTGTLANSTTTTLTNPGTVLLGATGATTNNGGSNYGAMNYYDGAGGVSSGPIKLTANFTTDGDVQIFNTDTNSTNSYRVVLFYQ